MSCLRLALAAAGLFALTSCSRPQPDTLTTNRSSDGSVLQGADSKRIYLITAGKRHYIQTPQTLQALGVVNRVMSSPDSFLSSIPEGVPLPPLNSPLIQKASPTRRPWRAFPIRKIKYAECPRKLRTQYRSAISYHLSLLIKSS